MIDVLKMSWKSMKHVYAALFLINTVLFIIMFLRIHPGFGILKIIYYLDFIVTPALFFIITALIYRKRRDDTSNRIWISHTLIGVILFFSYYYTTHVEPRNLKIRNVTIVNDRIKSGITLVHISDIQTAGIGNHENRVFKILADLKPDIILHTGDLVQAGSGHANERELEKLAALFKTLNPRYGIYNVMGDTDTYRQTWKFDRISGVKTLVNRETVITRGNNRINILGLSLRESRHGSGRIIKNWLQRTAGRGMSIVLGHAPDYIIKIKNLDIDLCLAGHTHGGQVRLPFIGPLVTFSRIPDKYSRGFHTWDRVDLNVSAGIGAEHAMGMPSIRFNCLPEITVITILPADK